MVGREWWYRSVKRAIKCGEGWLRVGTWEWGPGVYVIGEGRGGGDRCVK